MNNSIVIKFYISLMVLAGFLLINIEAVSQTRENANALELPAVENKLHIDKLIARIDNEAGKRVSSFIQKGESLPVTAIKAEHSIQAKLHDNIIYIISDGCANVEDIQNWNFLLYPLKIDTSASRDVKRPAVNFKAQLFKNGSIIQSDATSKCISHIEFPKEATYKIIGHKTIGSKRYWTFEKRFAEDIDYLHINKLEGRIKLAPKGSVVCRLALRLCFSNSRKSEHLGHLTINGFVGVKNDTNFPGEFYLESRRTSDEIKSQFPKFALEEFMVPDSMIAKFIADNLEHTIVVSVRDNAMGHLKEMDISELKKLGVDVSAVKIRGAHVSILQPNMPALNISNNEDPVIVSPEDHKVPFLGMIMSAGFSMGDNSVINQEGKNFSTNQRGINIAVFNSKGKFLKAQNFDTHLAANRSQGIYRVNLLE